MSNTLKEIVKQIQFVKEWSIEDVAKSINYSRVHLNKEMNKGEGNQEIKELLIKKHSDILQNVANQTYTQKRNQKKLESPGKRIPLYDAPASGGITETDMTPIHAPAGTIDVGDLLHDSQAAIRIYGNSMLPGYPPGCVVGLNKITADFIEPGEVYVIETRDRRILKRLFYRNDDPEGDKIQCISDNNMTFTGGARDGKLAYPPFLLPKSEIIALYAVTGVIKRNTNSVIINRDL